MTSPRESRGDRNSPPSRGVLPNSDALAALFVAAGASPGSPMGDVGFHQGTVLAWDSLNRTNTILVLGTPIDDVPVLTTGDNVLLSVGNQVGVLRFKTTYFVLGRITSPGGGNAFAWSYAENATTGDVTTLFPAWGDLTPNTGPTLTFEVGSSRRALIFMSAAADVGTNTAFDIGLQAVGVNTFGPRPEMSFINNSTTDNFFFPTTQFVLYTDNAGSGNLEPGPTTLTFKYQLIGAGTASVSHRRLLVIPF